MNNKKSTKRALISSVLSLVLCMSMLIGTTFAWFTDNVSSVNNIIKSGNLDVEFEYSTDMTNWTKVEETTEIFDDETLWEPGYTEVVYLRVLNKGSLALKYQLGVDVINEVEGVNQKGETFKLSEYIKYGVTEDVTDKYASREAAVAALNGSGKALEEAYSTESSIPAGDNVAADVYALVVYMPETVGNEANHNGEDVPEIQLGLSVLATQFTKEEDSFDDKYDAFADYDGEISGLASLKAALTNGGTYKVLNDINLVEKADVPAGVEVTLDLNGKSITVTERYDSENNKIHALVNNGTLTLANGNVVSAAENGGSAIYNAKGSKLVLEEVKVVGAPQSGGAWPSYAINSYGELIINDADITSTHGAIALYGDTVINDANVVMNGFGGSSHVFYIGGEGTDVVVNGGTYIHNGNIDGSLAYIMTGATMTINGGNFSASNGGYGIATYTGSLTVNGGNFTNAFQDWGGPISIAGGTHASKPADEYIAEGYTSIKNSDGTYSVVKGVAAADNNELKEAIDNGEKNIVLSAGKYEFPDIPKGTTIIGQEGVVFNDTLSGTLEDVTIKNVEIEAENAQRWAYSEGTLLFEDCTFKATSVYAIHYDGLNGANITYKNCKITGWVAIGGGAEYVTFDGCEIYGNGTYGVIRLYSPGTIKNCKFDVSEVNPTDVYEDGIHAVDCEIKVSNNTNVNGDMKKLYNLSGTGKIVEE